MLVAAQAAQIREAGQAAFTVYLWNQNNRKQIPVRALGVRSLSSTKLTNNNVIEEGILK